MWLPYSLRSVLCSAVLVISARLSTALMLHDANSHSVAKSTVSRYVCHRSHDSLSLMHHANAAGSRPTTVARSAVPAQSMHTSSAAVRQPLAKLDINQQQQQQQQQPRQTESADSSTAGGQADAGCPVSMPFERHQSLQQQMQLQAHKAVAKHSHCARDATGTATARQLDQELQLMQKQQGSFQRESNMQSYQQTAGRQHQLSVDAKDVLKDSQEPRHVNCASHYDAISAHSESKHAEESHNLADMPESISGCESDNQTPTAGSGIVGRQEVEVSSGVSLTKPGCSAMESAQHAWRHPGLDSSCNADNHAAHYHQQWQQQQQQQNNLQVDLPAGIPLTPVLSQRAQPRDSLEASIWKLSSSQGKQQMPRNNVFGPQEQNMPPKGASCMYGLQPNRQKPNTHDESLHMVRDSLEATLQKLAARQ